MVTSSAQTLSELDDLLQDLKSMVPAASRPLPSPPLIAQPIPEIRSDDLYSDPNTENEDGYEPPPGPISFPPPPPVSPKKAGQIEPNPLDILEQQMAALEALKEQSSVRISPSHTYSKPSLEKKSPPKISHKKPSTSRPEPPKFPPNQGPADYLETSDVLTPSKLPPDVRKSELLKLDKLMDSLNDFSNPEPRFAASLSYDHLAAEQKSQRYDMLQNAKQKEVESDYTEIPEGSTQEAEYAYPEVSPSKAGVEEHFYEAIPQDKKSQVSKNKEPSPYMEVTQTQPKLSGMKVPPRPTYKPNEKSTDRLQGLNDLMASLEDIKPTPTSKLQPTNPPKPSRPPNTNEDINPYLSQLDALQLSLDDNMQTEMGELDNIVGTLQKDASKKGLDTDSQGNCTACKMPILGNVSSDHYF
eukprot:TRINITY_DN7478_c0_g2_i2.p1 TRINITY_DN7478_c0_g2~~TRINITY_DN7478_c0_g2_i2.p1  ORF type:complete len:413 (-),score=126.43 TRINITY_DN7478_c0_g2_i2:452-1690(-)